MCGMALGSNAMQSSPFKYNFCVEPHTSRRPIISQSHYGLQLNGHYDSDGRHGGSEAWLLCRLSVSPWLVSGFKDVGGLYMIVVDTFTIPVDVALLHSHILCDGEEPFLDLQQTSKDTPSSQFREPSVHTRGCILGVWGQNAPAFPSPASGFPG
jgi:hypothetical protein